MPSLAFFPWLKLTEPTALGAYRLVPYNVEATLPSDLKRIVKSHKQGRGAPVDHAVIIEVDGNLESEINDEQLADIFRLREFLCFAALARRQFFYHSGYLNAHSLQCVVQDYKQGEVSVATSARRRGGNSKCLWLDERAVQCPAHVSSSTPLAYDAAFLEALLDTDAQDEDGWLRDGIELFNLANTDSPDVRPHTELVLCVAATQRLMGAEKRSDARHLGSCFSELLATVAAPTRDLLDCKREPVARLTKPRNLREVWFDDFYASRGVVAHGRPAGKPRSIWTIMEHLLLASFIIPRLVKVRLAGEGRYLLTEHDHDELAAFDYLLCEADLTTPRDKDDVPEWPWREALYQAARVRHEAHFHAALAAELFDGQSESDG